MNAVADAAIGRNTHHFARVAVFAVVLVSGCAEPVPNSAVSKQDAPKTAQATPAVEPPSAPATDARADVPRSSPLPATAPAYLEAAVNNSAQASSAPSPTGPPVDAASGPPQLRVRLRGGVALPQTLPQGTAMGFAVEYVVVGGAPLNACEWVIEPPQGAPWKQSVTLKNEGTLNTFVLEWPPEPGVYTAYIQQPNLPGAPLVISNKLQLSYSF